MYSLILTSLLGLFCCSSVNNNTLDHTKEIDVNEIPQKNIWIGDTESVSMSCDYLSNDFLTFAIERTQLLDKYGADSSNDRQYIQTYEGPNQSLTPTLGRLSVFDSTNITFRGVEDTDWCYVKQLRFLIISSDTIYDMPVYHIELSFMNNNDDKYVWFDFDCWRVKNSSVYSFSSYQVQVRAGMSRDFCVITPRTNLLDSYINIRSYYYDDGYYDGFNNGKSVGYQEGVQYALDNLDYDATASTIFTGITSIALVPIDMFLRIFNFEILGINVAGLVTGILTMAVIIIVIRMITGNKND